MITAIFSGVRILRIFTVIKLEETWLSFICRESELGSHGEVADDFAYVVKALWSGQYRFITPRDFKVSIFNSCFSQRKTLKWVTFLSLYDNDMSCDMTKPTKWLCAQRRPRSAWAYRTVWSESLLCTQWVAKDPSFIHADSEDSDQTGQMPRLIWVFAGRTDHIVGFVMRRLISWLRKNSHN